jgi:hypothetical protein
MLNAALTAIAYTNISVIVFTEPGTGKMIQPA